MRPGRQRIHRGLRGKALSIEPLPGQIDSSGCGIGRGDIVHFRTTMGGYPSTIGAASLCYLFQRSGESRMVRWEELNLGDALWTISASRITQPMRACQIFRGQQQSVTGNR